jgi:DNA-binding NarL/FixJ family response regulator
MFLPMPSNMNSTRRPRELSCVVVEDQGLFLDLLSGMLGLRGGLRVVAAARTVAEGRAACEKHLPDLLVLDLDLPDGNGLEVAEFLLKTKPEARVMVVSGHASGFVCPAWLNDNLQAIIDKNETFSSLRAELDEILPAAETTTKPLPERKKIFAHKPLTPRESEILALIGEGLTSKEIGERLHLSEHTVQEHRKRISTKLGTKGGELLQRAIAQRGAFFRSKADS